MCGIWEKNDDVEILWCLYGKIYQKKDQNKKSVLRKVQVKWMTMTNERFDLWSFTNLWFVYLVMKDELGIWNKGAEEEKIKPVESY